MTSRFAPSTTGDAHPGTLLSGLLCWLDARSRGQRVVLRFEDLDPARCKPAYLDRMRADLDWFGLDWDDVIVQSDLRVQHEAALDVLQARGLLYACQCTRRQRRQHGRRAPDGGFAYANTCRDRGLPGGGWRVCDQPVRARLPDRAISLIDEGGVDLSQTPARDMGDPIVVRRDGAIAYHLAVVVDDAASQVARIVRGRDIAPSTATHVLLQRALGFTTPVYRHHFLLMQPDGDKLAKFHGAVGVTELKAHYSAEALCGLLAWVAGLCETPDPRRPAELVPGFSWTRVTRRDRTMAWRDGALEVTP